MSDLWIGAVERCLTSVLPNRRCVTKALGASSSLHRIMWPERFVLLNCHHSKDAEGFSATANKTKIMSVDHALF